MMILGYFIAETGCGDNSCLIKKPKGMGTNGGCTCTRNVPRNDVLAVKRGISELIDLRKQHSLTSVEPDTTGVQQAHSNSGAG